MNKKTHITQLFNKLLDNSITDDELQKFLTYIRRSESDREIKKLMDDQWHVIKNNVALNEQGERSEELYSELLSKLNSHRDNIEEPNSSKPASKAIPLQWIGIAASILLIISLGIYWNLATDPGTELPASEQLASKSFNGKQVVNLPDGSSIILNVGSQLTYSEDFGQETREILFSGEGYFNIVHDPNRPFVVHTDHMKTTVLGTSFNLVSYKDKSDLVVTVERGEVAVGDDKRTYDKILPQQQMVVNKQTREFEKEIVDLEPVLAWKDKFLILDGITIANAAEVIGSRFDVRMTIKNKDLRNCKISAAFMKGESLEQILRVVCGVLQAEYTIDGKAVDVTGGRKCD